METSSSQTSNLGIAREPDRKLQKRPSHNLSPIKTRKNSISDADMPKPDDVLLARRTSRRWSAKSSPGTPADTMPRRASNTLASPRIVEDYSEFDIEFEKKLDTVGKLIDCTDNQLALLKLVSENPDDETEALAQTHLKLHAKDVFDILSKILNRLGEKNKVILHITEAHYLDTLSLELLLELAVACPRISIFCFSRPPNTFESKEHKRTYRLITQLPRSTNIVLKGLSEVETTNMILAAWTNHPIKSVDPKIGESIFRRTDGNPFFIRSLVLALKESGQWRISPNGTLTTPDPNFDFDKLVLGYDNQNIVLAQYDKLDRNFQLFLKIASVLGTRFALDDVFYFITGLPDLSLHIDKQQYQTIVKSIEMTDKYDFLIKETVGTDGTFFLFKSALVHKCIYSIMVTNQRMQLHLLVARYLEEKLNDQTRHKFVVPIFDHYMNTASNFKKERLQYAQITANYFFEKESIPESIKYGNQVLQLLEEYKNEEFAKLSDLVVSNLHRELGYALMLNNELEEAKTHLEISLNLMGIKFPKKGYQFKLALRKQQAIRKKQDLTFFKDRPPPQEEDYTRSYVAKKGGSGYSLNNFLAAPAPSKDKRGSAEEVMANSTPGLRAMPAVSPAQKIIRDTRESLLAATQHALVTFAEILLKLGDFMGHYYAVLLGLNIATQDSMENNMSKLFSLGSLALKHVEKPGSTLSVQYMQASQTFDLRTDIHISVMQVLSNTVLLVLKGQFEAGLNKMEVLIYLTTMAADLDTRLLALNAKAMLQTSCCTHPQALTTARDLQYLSMQREHPIGHFWGNFHIINTLLGDSKAKSEIKTLAKIIAETSNDFQPEKNASLLPAAVAKEAIIMLVSVCYGTDSFDYKAALEKINVLINQIPPFEWSVYQGMIVLALALFYGIRNKNFDESSTNLVDQVLKNANTVLKSIKGLGQLSESLRRVFKGCRFQLKGNVKQAAKKWKKGLDDESEDIYVQAILLSAIGLLTDDEEYRDKAESHISDLKAKAKFNFLFPCQ
jgi:hypothetical protein